MKYLIHQNIAINTKGAKQMRYIDADRLISVLQTNFGHTGGADVLKQLINEQPTADVEEVVRCKDCKYSERYEACDGSFPLRCN